MRVMEMQLALVVAHRVRPDTVGEKTMMRKAAFQGAVEGTVLGFVYGALFVASVALFLLTYVFNS